MPYSEEKRSEALELLEQEVNGNRMSLRAVARTVGVTATTVANWAHAAGIDTTTTDITKDTTAAGLSLLMVKKARKMLGGIENLDSKAAMEKATAVEKLTNSYLKLQGLDKPEDPLQATQVNILLQDLLRAP